MTDAAVDASRPVVGSSRNKTDGDIINSIPILVRFRSPPEMPRMNSFPTCHSKSEINKGHGMLFFFLFLSSGNVFKVCLILTLLSIDRKDHFFIQTGAMFSAFCVILRKAS